MKVLAGQCGGPESFLTRSYRYDISLIDVTKGPYSRRNVTYRIKFDTVIGVVVLDRCSYTAASNMENPIFNSEAQTKGMR